MQVSFDNQQGEPPSPTNAACSGGQKRYKTNAGVGQASRRNKEAGVTDKGAKAKLLASYGPMTTFRVRVNLLHDLVILIEKFLYSSIDELCKSQ